MAQVTHRPTGSRRTGSRLSIDHALVQIVRGLERHRDVIVGEPFDSRGPEDERARQVSVSVFQLPVNDDELVTYIVGEGSEGKADEGPVPQCPSPGAHAT